MNPVTTNTLRPQECLSSGYIYDKAKKDKERELIKQQTEEFYKRKANVKN